METLNGYVKCRLFFVSLVKRISRSEEKSLIVLLIVVVLITGTTSLILGAKLYQANNIEVYYSLKDKNNDEELIRVIEDARKYIYFAIYFFTKDNIASALIEAKKRGLVVAGISDKSAVAEGNAEVVKRLRQAGIPMLAQKRQNGIMHVKALVTESAYASGSYNWTASATNINDEVLEIGKNEKVRQKYLNIIKGLLIENQ